MRSCFASVEVGFAPHIRPVRIQIRTAQVASRRFFLAKACAQWELWRIAMNQPALEQKSSVAAEARRQRGAATLRAVRSVANPVVEATASTRPAIAARPERALSRVRQAVLDLSPLDWLVVSFFTLLATAVLVGSGPTRGESFALVGADWVALLVGLSLSRGRIIRLGTFANALVYRLTIFGTVVSSYFQLRVILPTFTSRALDASIFAFDMRLFHVEPSLAWDRFVTPQTTEWFAFFYFGYFFLLAIHVLPFMLLARNTDILARFALGVSMVFCIGHLTYMLVPGYGPYAFLAHEFHHDLSGGTFWGLVQEAVKSAGAQKDIFPSLHTAVPTFFALFAFRYRREQWPFRYTWPIMAFCALQIIGATMFLRWHYLIDIFAGVALAAASDALAARLVPWDDRRRAAQGLVPAWSQLILPLSWVRSPAERAQARG